MDLGDERMSVYDEICEWIISDVVEGIVEGEFDRSDLDMVLYETINQNIEDLSDSIWDREKEMYEEINRRLKKVKQ